MIMKSIIRIILFYWIEIANFINAKHTDKPETEVVATESP